MATLFKSRSEFLSTSRIGIIGGSGLYSMPGFDVEQEHSVDTPWGKPSDSYVVGKLAGKEVQWWVVFDSAKVQLD